MKHLGKKTIAKHYQMLKDIYEYINAKPTRIDFEEITKSYHVNSTFFAPYIKQGIIKRFKKTLYQWVGEYPSPEMIERVRVNRCVNDAIEKNEKSFHICDDCEKKDRCFDSTGYLKKCGVFVKRTEQPVQDDAKTPEIEFDIRDYHDDAYFEDARREDRHDDKREQFLSDARTKHHEQFDAVCNTGDAILQAKENIKDRNETHRVQTNIIFDHLKRSFGFHDTFIEDEDGWLMTHIQPRREIEIRIDYRVDPLNNYRAKMKVTRRMWFGYERTSGTFQLQAQKPTFEMFVDTLFDGNVDTNEVGFVLNIIKSIL